MSPDFLEAFNLLMQFEGGLVNDSDDAGGLTKFGISSKTYPDVNIAALSRDDARDIYYRDFWCACCLDRLCFKSKRLAERIFIMGVLVGLPRMIQITQSAINIFSDIPIAVDGRMGAATIMAIQGIRNPGALAAAHKILTGQYLLSIGTKKYLSGWLIRNEAA
jgi:lysozyme family protein